MNPTGRPRSDEARQAVLDAVDDLLVEVGYAAMTMKNIAERAGVGRPTVYRWWSSKAEILVEACVEDAAAELATDGGLVDFLAALNHFLVHEPPGLAYRALLGEAQHDPAVAAMLREAAILGPPAVAVLHRLGLPADELAVTQLIGPVLAHVLITSEPLPAVRRHAETWLAVWS